MENYLFLGIDVSKLTLDACCIQSGLVMTLSNDKKGFNSLFKALSKQNKAQQPLWVVFENTGIYSQNLANYCTKMEIRFSQVSGLEILRSQGISRSKTDKVDARKICKYAMEKASSLKHDAPTNTRLMKMKSLLSLRDKLVIQSSGLKKTAKELQVVLGLKASDIQVEAQIKIANTIDIQIKKIALELKELLNEDEELKRTMSLLLSIKGVGEIIAYYTIVYTKNFTAFENSRKFSCYCGTAPFPYTSGTSVRGKTKVNHLANKKLKSLLELGARSAITCDPEIKQYYKRRLELGKNKTSTLNIVRNKLIGRMFAVVKNQRPYEIKFAA